MPPETQELWNTRTPAVPAWGLGPFVRADTVNPILGPDPDSVFDCPLAGRPVTWEKGHVFNPAATLRGGQVCLLYRAEDGLGEGLSKHTSRLGLAQSVDGLCFTRRPAPVLYPADDAHREYSWPGGIEDPRLVETEEGGYVLTYTKWDRKLARLSVATSRDLETWEKHGPVFAQARGGLFGNQWSKSGAIVTRREEDRLIATKINGLYWMYWGEGIVYAATSPDLLRWDPVTDEQGALVVVFGPRPGRFDSALAEPGPPPVLTGDGIVMLYNGKNAGGAGGDVAYADGAYSAGQALLDPQQPDRLLARTDAAFLTPERPYERVGQYTGGTVFVEGLVHFQARWWLYYGTADSHVAVAATPAP